jgi:3-hydroxybutyryl-CoA dehydrogenase
MAETRRVAVIGAGTMGNGIVHLFAQHGYDVSMIDVRPEALEEARSTIAANMDRQIRKGDLTEEEKAAALGRIHAAEELAAAESAELVIEAATENRDL